MNPILDQKGECLKEKSVWNCVILSAVYSFPLHVGGLLRLQWWAQKSDLIWEATTTVKVQTVPCLPLLSVCGFVWACVCTSPRWVCLCQVQGVRERIIAPLTLVSKRSPLDSSKLTPPRGERIRQSARGMNLCVFLCVGINTCECVCVFACMWPAAVLEGLG